MHTCEHPVQGTLGACKLWLYGSLSKFDVCLHLQLTHAEQEKHQLQQDKQQLQQRLHSTTQPSMAQHRAQDLQRQVGHVRVVGRTRPAWTAHRQGSHPAC